MLQFRDLIVYNYHFIVNEAKRMGFHSPNNPSRAIMEVEKLVS